LAGPRFYQQSPFGNNDSEPKKEKQPVAFYRTEGLNFRKKTDAVAIFHAWQRPQTSVRAGIPAKAVNGNNGWSNPLCKAGISCAWPVLLSDYYILKFGI